MTAPRPQILMTRSQTIEMYARYPGALAEEVGRVLRPLKNDEDRVQHNSALGRFITLFGTEQAEGRLWLAVAKAILDTAISEGV